MSLLQAILNARSTRLTSLPYTVGATVLSVEDASQFTENLTASVDFHVVIFDRSYGSAADALKAGRYEIVKVTGDAVNDLTVVRAQEGTTAVAFDTGGIWEMVLAPTKAMFDELVPKSDIVNVLTSTDTTKPASANLAKVLNEKFKILQVVQGTTSTSVTVTTTTYTDTTLEATLPSLATTSSRVKVTVSQFIRVNASGDFAAGGTRLLRGTTEIYQPGLTDEIGDFTLGVSVTDSGTTSLVLRIVMSYSYIDSPATTGAVTYKTQIRPYNTGHTMLAQEYGATASIILEEIA